MIRKNKNGFTLVELLAVIVILAIILVIAVPQIMSTIKDTTKASLESSAKMVAAQVEKQYTVAQTLGKEFDDTGSCMEDWAGLNDVDYASCTYEITSNGTAKVTIKGQGKFKNLYVCSGIRSNATATEEECTGGGVPVLNCTFDGQLVQGAEFVHNQYTYRYMQEATPYYSSIEWDNIDHDGWGVALTDLESTEQVNTPICTYINGKPIVSTSYMFYYSAATSIDLSSFNTSNVTNMRSMFSESDATSLDLSKFNTSQVTDMSNMFSESAATSLDLSNFDTSKVTNMSGMFSGSGATSLDLSNFDTSNVTDMSNMFSGSAATSLDLSNFDTSKVTNMCDMFYYSAATSIDLSGFNTSNVTAMRAMFSGSYATSLDLSNFDTSKVTTMNGMFSGSAVTTIYVGDQWNTSNTSDSSYMFINATNLVGGNGTTYNSNYIDKTYARVDTASTPGYFTYKASN